jgi:NTP pyrophosphatase (non-canonical NTP hydrolase)
MLEKQGLVKLVEECGELIQVASKKMACMDSDEHWDGAGLLSQRLEDEMGDVLAAIAIVASNFDLDWYRIGQQKDRKQRRFRKWMEETDAPISKVE